MFSYVAQPNISLYALFRECCLQPCHGHVQVCSQYGVSETNAAAANTTADKTAMKTRGGGEVPRIT